MKESRESLQKAIDICRVCISITSKSSKDNFLKATLKERLKAVFAGKNIK